MTITNAEPEDYDKFWLKDILDGGTKPRRITQTAEDLERAERIAAKILDNPPPEGLYGDNFDDLYEVEDTPYGPQVRLAIQENLQRRD